MKTLKKIKRLLSQNKVLEAIELLEDICRPNKNLENRVILLSARYKNIKEKENLGLITGEESQVELQRLINNILFFLVDVEEQIDYQLIDLTIKKDVDFLTELPLEGLERIFLIGHTGRNLLTNFHRVFEQSQYRSKPVIKILLRSPYAETQNRFQQVYNSIEDIISRFRSKHYNISINYYEAVPNFRCILCEYKNGHRINFISFYSYIKTQKTTAWNKSFIIKDNAADKNHFVQYIEDWFFSFFGQKNVHTIVFDFDDTLADTLNLQVEAWLNTIKKLLHNKTIQKEYLNEQISINLESDKLVKKAIKKIFLDKQMAKPIKEEIFCKVPPEEEIKVEKAIKAYRFKERERLTKRKAKLFYNVRETLYKLSENYKLAIISSTSEILIMDILKKFRLMDLFTDVYGKHGPKQEWENVEDKSEKLIKLSKKLGVPLNRMIYIGDNHSDYKATKQLGIKFIEARIQAERNNIETLISYDNNKEQNYFDTYDDNTLTELIESYNDELEYSKEKLNIKFLKKI